MTEVPVLIAGGGPVGMTLALELASHGISSLLVERNSSTTHHPKMDLTNGRSMELYRRLGVSEQLRAVGVPEDNPLDIQWATSPQGHLLHRFAYPSAAQSRARTAHLNDGAQTREPGMRVSQILLEPVLKQAVDNNPLVDVRFGWAFEGMEQDADGVVSKLRNGNGDVTQIRSRFLVGCDGGGSTVRREAGIALDGQHAVARMYMVHFRSEARALLNPWGIAWHLQTGLGTLVAQDDRETWTLHCPLPPGADEKAIDPADLVRQFVGCDFDFEILVANPWSPHMLVAERYRQGHVFLAGDAAHQYIPTGGFGMNTGVGDAVDLGWKLAAYLNGWGGEVLLDSYSQERHNIGLQNRAAAYRNFDVRMQIAGLFVAAAQEGGLDGEGKDADTRRKMIGETIAALGNAENESWGIEHGYRYNDSPVNCGESTAQPAFDPLYCTPATSPGARLPHLFLADGSALFDQLGPEFSLLCIGEQESAPLVQAASVLGLPLKVVTLAEDPRLALLERKLLLVRPDQHIAWRGDSLPTDCLAVLRRVTGQPLDAAQRQAIEHECAVLANGYAFLVDHRRHAELVELFSEDCAFVRPDLQIQGRAALLEYMEARPPQMVTRHLCSTPYFETVEADYASAVTTLTFYQVEAPEEGIAQLNIPKAVVEYHDEFHRTAEGWRIALRRVVPVMLRKD